MDKGCSSCSSWLSSRPGQLRTSVDLGPRIPFKFGRNRHGNSGNSCEHRRRLDAACQQQKEQTERAHPQDNEESLSGPILQFFLFGPCLPFERTQHHLQAENQQLCGIARRHNFWQYAGGRCRRDALITSQRAGDCAAVLRGML